MRPSSYCSVRFVRLFGIAAVGLVTAGALGGCMKKEDDEPMTTGEAISALQESNADSQAASLTNNTIEISTNFTIGKAVKDAASELRTFIETQLPCADITLVDSTLTVTYGAKPGNCVYRGQKFTGQHIVKVTKNDADIEVDHEWKELSNGVVKVSGTAEVRWKLDAKERVIAHDLTWTRLADGKTGRGTGERTQSALAGGITEGFQESGSRDWAGDQGKWNLAIDGVQMRWVDPCPQAGSYTLVSPKGRSLELSFRRVDEDTIEVTLSSGEREFRMNVNKLGGVESKSDGSKS